mmetsp:Transcript_25104/g.74918  ORF Transcript_25104/g.74918 Transcript_25104/m.74918 type:complete len:417 (-) Transcript_25104:82-1332(-)
MLAIAVLYLVAPALALDNGLARTPPMGYNSWYDVECSAGMTEESMKRVADRMVELGLDRLGYRYLNLDDCWAKGRTGDGTIYADKSAFPSGTLKELADYVHSRGLLFGTYTDRGTKTCGGRPGAQGYESIDAKAYASWGVDYLKEDSCYASTDHAVAFAQYGKMRDALNATGRPVLFSLCGWNDWYAPVGASLGNAWRTGPDDTDWPGVLKNIDVLAGLERYAGPGGWNDPCLLLSKTWQGRERMTELQSRAQFSMWAVLAAPLLISGSLFEMSTYTLATYTNKEVIAVSQDPLGKAGSRIAGGSLEGGGPRRGGSLASMPAGTNVWARPLADGSHALVFLNAGGAAADVTCGPDCFARIAVGGSDRLAARDLWAATDLPDVAGATFTARALAPHGGHLMIAVKALPKEESQAVLV